MPTQDYLSLGSCDQGVYRDAIDRGYSTDPTGQPRTVSIIPGLLGTSQPMRTLALEIKRSGASDFSVLVSGESGTGKELVARSLHDYSSRKRQPFVPVNCAALPEDLIESLLFGHVKGSFTGAIADQRGLFYEAGGGTLFLDEIGEMPLRMQAKLLRVLQEKEVMRVGAVRPVKVDVRVIAATNQDLALMVKDGSFRQDLYYRLSVLEIRVPALRERRDDIPLLAAHFLQKAEEKLSRTARCNIEMQATELLSGYDWPGNVRELENTIHRLVVRMEGQSAITWDNVMDVLRARTVAHRLKDVEKETKDSTAGVIRLPEEVLEFRAGETTRSYILRVKLNLYRIALAQNRTRTEAARQLGMSVNALKKGLRYSQGRVRQTDSHPIRDNDSREIDLKGEHDGTQDDQY
jgi:transcriptional regulator with GAF, ATPase, and Fis domain